MVLRGQGGCDYGGRRGLVNGKEWPLLGVWVYYVSVHGLPYSLDVTCSGWKFVLSTLPARQNPSTRSLANYQTRIIR